jgi:hypothetical protein
MALTIPNRFFPGTLVDADQMNANFDSVVAYANSSLETVATHNSDIALLPKGKMGYVQVTASQGSITTVVDLTSLTLTFTALASRYYRVTGFVFAFTSTVSTDRCDFSITDGAGTRVQRGGFMCAAGSGGVVQVVLQPGAGSKTYKLRAERVGTGTITMNSDATSPCFILIEDVGL